MTHSNQIIISITLTGEVSKKNLLLRSGAKIGDYIFISGPIGNGRAGLRVFQENLEDFNQEDTVLLRAGKKKFHRIKLLDKTN